MSDICTIVMPVGDHRYVVLFDREHESEAYRTVGRWTGNPELNLTWYEAAQISQQIREFCCSNEGNCHMEEFEALAKRLKYAGFFPRLGMETGGWRCELFTAITHRPPRGQGVTALDALKAADADRQDLLAAAAARSGNK